MRFIYDWPQNCQGLLHVGWLYKWCIIILNYKRYFELWVSLWLRLAGVEGRERRREFFSGSGSDGLSIMKMIPFLPFLLSSLSPETISLRIRSSAFNLLTVKVAYDPAGTESGWVLVAGISGGKLRHPQLLCVSQRRPLGFSRKRFHAASGSEELNMIQWKAKMTIKLPLKIPWMRLNLRFFASNWMIKILYIFHLWKFIILIVLSISPAKKQLNLDRY